RGVKIPATAREIAGAELEKLLQRMIAHQKFLETVERRGHPREIVEALLAAGADREYFAGKDKLEDVDEPVASADGTAIGGGPVDEATRLAAEPKDARARVKAKPADVTLHSLD